MLLDAPKRKTGDMDQVGFRAADFSQKTAKRTHTFSHMEATEGCPEEGCDKMALRISADMPICRFEIIVKILESSSTRYLASA